ncbi:recombinase family protein [Streptomyces sp. NPDC058440]|uniref:recombinase family protein n=1 Tax=Streptomyces sp. NPDC058440 TaxID=3346501 RepID=UPI0036627B19
MNLLYCEHPWIGRYVEDTATSKRGTLRVIAPDGDKPRPRLPHLRRQGRPEVPHPALRARPQLRAELEVRIPVDRGPGRPWGMGPAVVAAVPEAATKPTRVGYARCRTAQQELQGQLDALAEVGCGPVFSEKISTRVKVRPDFVKAMDFARTIKKAVPRQRVIFTVPEMKRLGRGAAELLTIAEDLRHHDIQLELLTGPLQGVYDPSGHGAAVFAFFAGMAESEREYIREKSLAGQASARERGRHGGRPKVVDGYMAACARSLRAAGQRRPRPRDRPQARYHLGQEHGRAPSVATVYRILATDEEVNPTA